MPKGCQYRQGQCILSIQSANRSNDDDACSLHLHCFWEAPLTQLMFKCPRTNRLVPTHVDIDLAEIDKLPDRVTFSQCPYCRTVHGWTPSESFVSEELQIGRPKQNPRRTKSGFAR